jgi:hypothetical protein
VLSSLSGETLAETLSDEKTEERMKEENALPRSRRISSQFLRILS